MPKSQVMRRSAATRSVVGIILAYVLGACADGGQEAPGSSTPKIEPTDIVIAMTSAKTGRFAAAAAPLEESLAVAAQEINAAGGVLGRRVRLKVVDDSGDKTREVVSGLLGENVAGILGPVTSPQALEAQGLARDKRTVMISASATSTLLTTAQPATDRFFFRTAAPDDLQGRALARLGYDSGCRDLMIIYGADAYGSALAKELEGSFVSRTGTRIVGSQEVKTADTYQAVAGLVKDGRPQCVALLTYSDVGARLLRDIRAEIAGDVSHDWSKLQVLGSDGLYDEGFTGEGVIGTSPDPAPDTESFKTFRNLYRGHFPDREPGPYAAHQFDAAVVLALAIQRAGTATDGVRIRDALYDVSKGGRTLGPAEIAEALAAIKSGTDIDYRGASGEVDFDAFGNVKGDYVIWKKSASGFERMATMKASEL
jgi:neutral amino acid transport system substrate-binding protein